MNAYKEKYITQFYSTTLKIPPSMLGDDGMMYPTSCNLLQSSHFLQRFRKKWRNTGQTIEKYFHFGICRCSFLENLI